MFIDIRCPRCRATLEIPEAYRGRKVRCENCQHAFVVEGGRTATDPEPQVAEPDDGIQATPRATAPPPARRRPAEDRPAARPRGPAAKQAKRGKEAAAGLIVIAVAVMALGAAALAVGLAHRQTPAVPEPLAVRPAPRLPDLAPPPEKPVWEPPAEVERPWPPPVELPPQPPPVAPRAEAQPPPPDPATLAIPLRYRWGGGGVHVYAVRVQADVDNAREIWEGNCSYQVVPNAAGRAPGPAVGGEAAADEETFTVTLQGDVSRKPQGLEALPGFGGLKPPFLPGPMIGPPLVRRDEVQMDASGLVLKKVGGKPLPFLLGDLTRLVIDPLPAPGEKTREVAGECGVVESGGNAFGGVTVGMTGLPFPVGGLAAIHRANERTVTTRGAAAGDTVVVHKRYELATEAPAGQPARVRFSGEGPITFAVKDGMPRALEFKGTLTLTAGRVPERVPLTLTYRLLEGAERERALRQLKPPAWPGAPAGPVPPLNAAELPEALRDLKSPDPAVRAQTLRRLKATAPGERRAEVARALEALLGDRASQLGAVELLATWGDKDSVPALLKLGAGRAPQPAVVWWATFALGKIKDEGAAEAIARGLTEGGTRRMAGQALRARGAPAEKAVLPLLKHTDRLVREEVCYVLRDVGTPACRAGLEEVADEQDAPAAFAAREALRAIAARQPPARLVAAELSRLVEDLKAPKARRGPALRRLAWAAPGESRAEVARALEALLGGDGGTRLGALDALAVWGDKESVPPLLKWVGDPDSLTRWRTMIALGELKDPRAGEPLVRRFQEPLDRRVSAQALVALGAPAAEAVLPLLKHSEAQVRQTACSILLQVGTTREGLAVSGERRAEVAQALVPALDGDRDTRLGAIDALAVWGDKESVPALLKWVGDPDWGTRLRAMAALGRLKDARAAEPIAGRLPESTDRHAASQALRALGPPAEKAVIPLLKHADLVVRMEACSILEQIGTRESLAALEEATRDKEQAVASVARAAWKAVDARR